MTHMPNFDELLESLESGTPLIRSPELYALAQKVLDSQKENKPADVAVWAKELAERFAAFDD